MFHMWSKVYSKYECQRLRELHQGKKKNNGDIYNVKFCLICTSQTGKNELEKTEEVLKGLKMQQKYSVYLTGWKSVCAYTCKRTTAIDSERGIDQVYKQHHIHHVRGGHYWQVFLHLKYSFLESLTSRKKDNKKWGKRNESHILSVIRNARSEIGFCWLPSPISGGQ